VSALSEADTVLCLGFDGKYAQSVVETELHHAKRSGTRLITLDTRNYSLRKYADEWLQPAPGEEADLLEMFAEILRERTPAPQLWPIPPQAQRSVKILMESKKPVVLVGLSLLTHPDNVNLLKLLEKLLTQLHAELVVLPDKANLGGALQMGITNPLTANTLQGLDLLHLIGEELPAEMSGEPFVLYQNIFPPASAPSAGLILPVAAFSEEDGTFIDYTGDTRILRRAVQAPGNALPSWQILCRIAQKLDVPGFLFENEAQIRAEMESMKHAGGETDVSLLNLFQPDSIPFPARYVDDHAYMGFPLRTRVAGLQVLYPERPMKNK
jgi:anaerobic selenocysteine-containing dehydrogenase